MSLEFRSNVVNDENRQRLPDVTNTTSDHSNAPVPIDVVTPTTTANVLSPGWWIQVVRVRLRFLLIVVFAGAIVTQWPMIRGAWERWTWGLSHQHISDSVSSANEYFCPMDPGVVTAWPAICPICNMDLVPRRKMDAVMLPEGVVARMQLSPYRIQLAGIKTAVVEPRRLKFEQTFAGILHSSQDGSMGFEATIASGQHSFFTAPQSVAIRTVAMSTSIPATATVIDEKPFRKVRFVIDEGEELPEGSPVIVSVSIPYGDSEQVLAIPESAMINRGHDQLVYVETMPGVFDGVKVEVGRRCGAYYPVLKGLKPSQRVAAAGAFLIDAETNLNPSLATGYFGASPSESKSPTPPPAPSPTVKPQSTKSGSPKKALSREDQILADRQRICPVTELPLNSMGGPVSVRVAGRQVFICCQGCEKRLKDEPEKYLAKISPP